MPKLMRQFEEAGSREVLYEEILNRYIALRDERLASHYKGGWDPLINTDRYNKLAREHKEVLAAFIDRIEDGSDEFGRLCLDIAEYIPKHALELQNLLHEYQNLYSIYAQEAKHFQHIPEEEFSKDHLVAGTRLSTTQNKDAIYEHLEKNKKYLRNLIECCNNEGEELPFAQRGVTVERIGLLTVLERFRLQFTFLDNLKHPNASQFNFLFETPRFGAVTFNKANMRERGNIRYNLTLYSDGLLQSGKQVINRMNEKALEGYMFLEPTDALLAWRRENPNHLIFDERALITTLLEKYPIKDPHTQEKLRAILSPVLYQLE